MAIVPMLLILVALLAPSSGAAEQRQPLAEGGAMLPFERSWGSLQGKGGLQTGGSSCRCMRLVEGVIQGCCQPLSSESALLPVPVRQLGQGLKGAMQKKVSRALRNKQVVRAVISVVGTAMLSGDIRAERALFAPLVIGLAGMSGLPSAEALEAPKSSAEPVAPSVSIQPPFLDWQEVYICEPAAISLEVINTSDDADLTLFSVSTDNQQFFPSAFRQVTVLPGGSVNISLTFLPVKRGSAESTLLVQSSAGGFLVQMHGWGVPSHLKASPITGKKVLAGKSLTHFLVLHNPYSELLRVTEVFTSDDFLQLTLPHKGAKTAQPGGAGLWELFPQESKSVIEIEFHSQAPGKHSGLVHVAYGTVNGAIEGTLVIPVEVEAVQGGIYAEASAFDFGTLTVLGKRKELPLIVTNLEDKPIDIFDVYVEPNDRGARISAFPWTTGVLIPPGTEKSLAVVSFTGPERGGGSEEWVLGAVVINSNASVGAGAHLEIPFWGRAVYGSLGYDAVNTSFLVSSSEVESEHWQGRVVTQEIQLVNNFQAHVSFHSAAIPGDQNFEVVWLAPGHVAAPGGYGPLVMLTFRPTQPDLDYTTDLLIATNVTTLRVPLRVHTGRLKAFAVPIGRTDTSWTMEKVEELTAGQEGLSFGVVTPNHLQQKFFLVLNPTPEPIHIAAVHIPPDIIALRIAGPHLVNHVLKDLPVDLDFLWLNQVDAEISALRSGGSGAPSDASELKNRVFEHAVTRDLVTLKSGEVILVGVTMRGVEGEGRYEDAVVFTTARENLTVPFSFEVVRGGLTVSIEPTEIQTFPGRLQEAVVVAENLFDRELFVSGLLSGDPAFSVTAYQQSLPVRTPTEIGVLDIDVTKAVGQYLAGSQFRKWRQGGDACKAPDCSPVTPLQLQQDLEAVEELGKVLNRGLPSTQIATLLSLTTNVVKGYQIPVLVQPVIPSLVPGEDGDWSAYKSGDVVYEFSKVQIGGVAFESIDVANPSDFPLEVEIVLGVRKRRSESEESYLDGSLVECGMEIEAGGGTFFTLSADAVVHAVLAPREEQLFGPIALRPTQKGVESHASLFLHNNLTLLEEIELIAEGGSGMLVFQEGDSEVKEVRLELNGSYLGFQRVRDKRGWALMPGGKLTWPAVSSRTLKARNKGDVRLEVHSLQGCKGLGFSVSPCVGFSLEPGEMRELTFSYQPDFSAAVKSHSLRLLTSAGDVSVLLVGRVPKQLLPLCLELVPRWQMRTIIMQAAGAAFSVAALACGALYGRGWFSRHELKVGKARKGGEERKRYVNGGDAEEKALSRQLRKELYSRSSSESSTGSFNSHFSLPKSSSKASLVDVEGDETPQPSTPRKEDADEGGWIEAVPSRGQEKQGKKGGGKAKKGAEAAEQLKGKAQEQKAGGKSEKKGEGKPKKGARSQVAPEPQLDNAQGEEQEAPMPDPPSSEAPLPSPTALAPGRKKKKKQPAEVAKVADPPSNVEEKLSPPSTPKAQGSPLHKSAVRQLSTVAKGSAHTRKSSQGSEIGENVSRPHSPVARTRPHRTDVITVDSATGVVKQSVKLRTIKDGNGLIRRRNSGGGHERTNSNTSSGRSSPAGSGNYSGLLDEFGGVGGDSPLHPFGGSSPQHSIVRPGFPPTSPPFHLRRTQTPASQPLTASPPHRSLYRLPSFVDIPNDSVVERLPSDPAPQRGAWNRSKTAPLDRTHDPFTTIGSRSMNPPKKASPQANTYDIWGSGFGLIGQAPPGISEDALSPRGIAEDPSSLFSQSLIRPPVLQAGVRNPPLDGTPFFSAFPGFSVFASQAPPAATESPWSRAPAASAASVPFGALSQGARSPPSSTYPDAPSTIFNRSSLARVDPPSAIFRDSAPSLWNVKENQHPQGDHGSAYTNPLNQESSYAAFSKPLEGATHSSGSVFGARALGSNSLWSPDAADPPLISPRNGEGIENESFRRAPGRERVGTPVRGSHPDKSIADSELSSLAQKLKKQ